MQMYFHVAKQTEADSLMNSPNIFEICWRQKVTEATKTDRQKQKTDIREHDALSMEYGHRLMLSG